MRARWVVAAILAGGTATSLEAQQIQISKDNKTIAISTSDEAAAVADTAVVSVGFQTFGKDEAGTYADASRTSNAIVAALLQAGVPKDAIESQNQGLHPLGAGSDEDKARYAQGIRFSFSQDWRVTLAAGQPAKVLQIAIAAGANDSGNVDWQLKHDDALQAEAAGKALAHARDIAASMAKGLGVQLGPLVYASNQTPPRGIFANNGFGNVEEQNRAMASMVARQKTEPLAMQPQRITKSATVYAVFAIE